MRTGVTYLGHHNPKHIKTDLDDMVAFQLDEVLLAAQENDFIYFPGKLKFTAELAQERGLRPIAIIWGALNLFGGGRASQFLLENPSGFQVGRNGTHRAAGCYVNPICVGRIEAMIDTIAELGYTGYLIDEPKPLHDCFCAACQARYEAWYGDSLLAASEAQQAAFRHHCVIDYIQTIADYCQANHPQVETICCLMPEEQAIWREAAQIASLDNLGTDIYWINNNRNVEEMRPIIRDMAATCQSHNKIHHQWLQCWKGHLGQEHRVFDMGQVLAQEKPDALYIWAWEGQVGTAESCADPALAWAEACRVLALAKEQA